MYVANLGCYYDPDKVGLDARMCTSISPGMNIFYVFSLLTSASLEVSLGNGTGKHLEDNGILFCSAMTHLRYIKLKHILNTTF